MGEAVSIPLLCVLELVGRGYPAQTVPEESSTAEDTDSVSQQDFVPCDEPSFFLPPCSMWLGAAPALGVS